MARRSGSRSGPDGPAARAATTPGPAAAANDPSGGFVHRYLAYLLGRASHLISGQFHEYLRTQGVPVMHWRVLSTLWDGPMSARELADWILTKQPTTSKLLERMERQGLVTRETDPSDRRRIVVGLTPRGREVAGPLIRAAREHEHAVLEPFGEANAAALVRTLQRLIDRNARPSRPSGQG